MFWRNKRINTLIKSRLLGHTINPYRNTDIILAMAVSGVARATNPRTKIEKNKAASILMLSKSEKSESYLD